MQIGKIIIGLGILLVIAGIIIYFWGDKLSWIGHLPGDIRIEKENFRFYFPITTMILISVVITVLLRVFNKFFN
jgi:hypothetical protein